MVWGRLVLRGSGVASLRRMAGSFFLFGWAFSVVFHFKCKLSSGGCLRFSSFGVLSDNLGKAGGINCKCRRN